MVASLTLIYNIDWIKDGGSEHDFNIEYKRDKGWW